MSRALAVSVRVDRDVYPTPPDLARATLRRVRDDWLPLIARVPVDRILDPGAGEGNWGRAARELWPHALVTGVECREVLCPPGFDFWLPGVDFRPWAESHRQSDVRYDLICGNPPFRLAAEFIRAGRRLLTPGGVLAMLLRLDYLGSRKRGPFWEAHRPLAVYVVVPRPRFVRGSQDSGEYGVFVWGREGRGAATRVEWLEWSV